MLYDLTVSNAVVSNSALDGDASEMEEGKNINKMDFYFQNTNSC